VPATIKNTNTSIYLRSTLNSQITPITLEVAEILGLKYRATIRPLSSILGLRGIQASCLSEMVKDQRAQGRMKIYDFQAYKREIGIIELECFTWR
jgi:hypothetical protein